MKTIYILAFGLLFLAVKCNKQDWNITKNTVIELNGFIKNHKKVFNLGDTIVFEVKLPDTVIIRNKKDNTLQEVIAKKYEFAKACFFVRGVDTINKKTIFLDEKNLSTLINNRVNPNYDYGCADFITMDNAYTAKILIVPKTKGLFLMETPVHQNSSITINGNIRGVTRLFIGNADKNLELLRPYFQEWADSESFQLGVYGFRVE
jgi:hypothetical protein